MRQDVDDFLISIYVYFGMSGLFLLSQRYTCFKFKSVNSNVVFARYSEDAIENSFLDIYMYKFTKLWSLFLKEVLIIKFHCLWMLSFIFLYVLCSRFFFNSYFITLILYYHYFCYYCSCMWTDAPDYHMFETNLARNLNFLIWAILLLQITHSLDRIHEWLPIKHSFVRIKISPTNLVF